MGKNQHVISLDDRWAVRAEGSAQPFAVFKTQSDAWERAKAIARKERSEAILYGRNGLVRARSTYGTEPRPKGT
jgi:Uncharacterized protein conserved in bacteria (DUF2188)